MREERNEVVCNYCNKPGHVKSNCFKLMKKKQVEENGNGTRNGVAGTVTDIVLSLSQKKLTMRFGSKIAAHHAITAMTMGVYTSTKLFQRK
jgi:hypothetical protein